MITELDWTIRLVTAMICGGLVGYERTIQLKSAGIRTHMVVALGSALAMIVSKYAFFDILGLHNISLDPSRIAAQIISGISFLGAGTILSGHVRISGLTTAAGIWATAAIGMTIGAGLYYIGIISTILIVGVQFIFHDDSIINSLIFHAHIRLQVEAVRDQKAIDSIKKTLELNHVLNIHLNVLSTKKDHITMQIGGQISKKESPAKIMIAMEDNPNVISTKSEHM